MAADGESSQHAGYIRSPSRVTTIDAGALSRARRLVVFLAAAIGHLALIWMLRETMAPRLPQYVEGARVELSFVADDRPIPALAPPPMSAVDARAGSEGVTGPAAATPPPPISPSADASDPSRPRLYRPDGGLALTDDLLERLDGAAEQSIEFRIANLDKAGMFLRRPPIDYVPTRFDGFWVPHENLLEEWVRKGIQEVSIPIPGSSWRIVCKVSLLAPGGACGISPVQQSTNPIELAPYVPPPNRNR